MSSVSKSFTAVGDGPQLLVRDGESFTPTVSGTFVGTVVLQQFDRGGWTPLATFTAPGGATTILDAHGNPTAIIRFHCDAFTSGTIVTSLANVTTEVGRQVLAPDGSAVLQATEDGPVVPSGKTLKATSPALTTPLGAVAAVEATFTENGAGTYTAAIPIPAGASILDILVNGVVLWAAATSATLTVGDAGTSDGYYTGVNLKATDLLAGESLSFAQAGGKAGAYIANSQVSPRYSATARVVSGVVTSVGAGAAGVTRMTVIYHLPVAADVVAATQV